MTQWHASDYKRHSNLQQMSAQRQLALVYLIGDERVLDVGCGDGKITAEIASRVPRGFVVGVDPSSNMIAFASSEFSGPTHVNLHFEVADARQLPFKHEFDLVVSFNALHWVPEQEIALRCIHTALKPRGRAILKFVPQGQRKCLEDVIEDVRHEVRWSSYFAEFRMPYAHFTADEYRALAEKCGFRVVSLNVEDGSWDFETRDGFAGFARATFVEWTRRLPERLWGEFITDVLDIYQSIAADNPSELHTFKFYQLVAELAVSAAP